MRRRLAAAAVLAACLGAVPLPAGAEGLVVIDSSAPALPAGTTVDTGASIEVPAGQRIVLASQSGQVMTINGPYKGAPPATAAAGGAGSENVLKILPTLLGSADQRQAAGVVRATDAAWRQEGVKSLADVMAINGTDGGDICLYDPAAAMLVHNPSRQGRMTIEPMNGGDKVTVEWPQDTRVLPWPAALPIADGDAFMFEQAGDTGAAIATLHILPQKPDASELDRAAQLAEAGCRDQARLLVTLVANSAK